MSQKLSNKNPMTNADMLCTVEGVAGYWSQMSGLDESISRARFSDGESNRKRYATSGSSELAEITISRPFDPEDAEDLAAYDWAQSVKCGDIFQVQVRPVKRCNGVEFRGNKALFYYGCRLTNIKFMSDMDTGSGENVVMLTVTFSLDDYAWV
jgi:hypothetical protein